ncbi:hypothetical protein GCM10029964_033760 [Kibdelosporangium lantanae]
MPRAVLVRQTGGPEVLELTDVEVPAPGPGEVVVDVAAAGVNYIDTYHRSGAYPLETPFGLGLEGAGTITAVGPDTDFTVGERVAWMSTRGATRRRSCYPQQVWSASRTRSPTRPPRPCCCRE